MTAARVGARSVVTSSGPSWTASIRTKNLRAAAISRRADTRMSITWPCSSTARYTCRHAPATFTYVSSTNQRTPAVCRHGPAASTARRVKCWTRRYSVTWSTSIPRSASSSSTSRCDSRSADTIGRPARSHQTGTGSPRKPILRLRPGGSGEGLSRQQPHPHPPRPANATGPFGLISAPWRERMTSPSSTRTRRFELSAPPRVCRNGHGNRSFVVLKPEIRGGRLGKPPPGRTTSVLLASNKSVVISRHQSPASMVPGRRRRLSDHAFAQKG